MQFAVLLHQPPKDSTESDHFDLLLEHNGSLLTWRLPIEPLLEESRCYATELPPHRLVYLTYEGPISGDRGTVKRVAAGELEWTNLPGNHSGPLLVTLKGSEVWALTLTPPANNASDWVVEWHRLR
jgi:hypothetical protein